ncbi:MAG: hypothetical protein EXS16_01055 [Gemmataceae bacterium]|nr:hypothetical protein [Gemmataceae bacterium]
MHCRHCHERPATRPRGLCLTCYDLPGVRLRYPTTSRFGRRGLANGCFAPPTPTFPTQARPGSPEKIAVLAERVRQGVALWHPEDATLAGPVSEPALAG